MWLLVKDRQGRKTLALPIAEGTLVIGRAKGCNLLLPDDCISRRHVELTRQGNKVSFRDLGSAAGSILDGTPMTEGTLAPGQELLIGHTTLLVSTDENPPQLDTPADPPQRESSTPVDWLPFTTFLDTLRRAEEPERVVTRLLEGLVKLFAAQRGFVLLAPSPNAPLVTVAQHHISDDDDLIAVSSTVYKRAMEEGRPILIDNSHDDERCAGANSLVASEWPLTILCGPLATKGDTHGVVYLDRPLHVGPLASEHLNLFETVTGLTASLLATASTRKRLLAAHSKVRALWSIVNDDSPFILGESAQSQKLTETLKAAAAQDVSVLVTGETGTGKEMIARSLHNLSDRCKAPFVPVNCAALPADIIEVELFGAERGAYTGATEARVGRFELASGGTLFLDEVGELPLEVQVKLLRVLEERTITRLGSNEPIALHFRLVAATNRDLEQAAAEGAFRRDLYYRLNVFPIILSPLRQRPADILPLARHFLSLYARRFGKELSDFTEEAQATLMAHPWPGNVRQLRNAVERAALLAKSNLVTDNLLPRESFEPVADSFWEGLPQNYEEARTAFEKAFLERSMETHEGKIAKVVKATGIPRSTVYHRLKQLGLYKKDS